MTQGDPAGDAGRKQLFRRLHRVVPALALAATIACALVLVEGQPIRSPWWTYADADVIYAGSSLNLLLGNRVLYLDHPGLPLEEIGMLAFGADYVLERATGDVASRTEYVDRVMLDFDGARALYRGLAVAFYVLAAALSFVLFARLFAHWTWGLFASLLWLAAPGLAPMSIQFRPDVLLAGLLVVFAYHVGRAAERRSAIHYFAAALVLGFAVMVKMHAAGAVAALALAAMLRPPQAEWFGRLRDDMVGWARPRRGRLVAVGVAVGSLAVVTNSARAPFVLTADQRQALISPVLLLGVLIGLAVWLRRKRAAPIVRGRLELAALLVGGVVAGLAVPVAFDVPEGAQSLLNIRDGLTGRGVNEGVDPFSAADLDRLLAPDLRLQFGTFVVAGIGAVLGATRRDPRPGIWFTGAAALGFMAAARLDTLHYFAPAFVLSIPAAIWAISRGAPGRASWLVWPVALFIVWPQFDQRTAATAEVDRLASAAAPTLRLLEQRLGPDEAALTPTYWPHPDTRYFEMVRQYVYYTPDYRYRFLPAIPAGARFAADERLRLRFFTSPIVFHVAGTQTMEIPEVGPFVVRRLSDVPLAVELVEGPGADRPLDRPDARFDPETGYYRDPSGRFWDLTGAEVLP